MTIKEFIIQEVKTMDAYETSDIKNLEEVVDTFINTLEYDIPKKELNGVGERVLACLNSLASDSMSREDLVNTLTAINLAEIYARKVLYLVKPEKLERIEEDQRGYFPVLKALGFSDEMTRKMTNRRNEEGSHECVTLSQREMYERIDDFILDYIVITNAKLRELKKIVLPADKERSFFPEQYVQEIISQYEHEIMEGFWYLDVHWREDENTTEDYNIKNLVKYFQKEKSFGIKILGEAGTGKSTALRRIQYTLAKDYDKYKLGPIPVYVSLGEMTDGNGAILSKICEIIRIEKREVQELLKNSKLAVLLDGYNEVLNTEILSGIAREIDNQFRVYYPQMKLYLSDRTISRNSIPVITDAKKLFLKKITLDEKLCFFKAKTTAEVYDLILKKANDQPSYFEGLSTPYKMMQFIQIVEDTKSIPEDITEAFLRNLIERERNEKKEIEMRDIEDLLQALAIYMYDNNDENETVKGFDRITVLSKLAEIKNKLGFNVDTKRFLDVVIGMNILYEESGYIEFSNREYLVYFMLEGLDNGMDKLFVNT